MKTKNDDSYFEPTAWQIMAKWFAGWNWDAISWWITIMTIILLFATGIVAVLVSSSRIDRSCVGNCRTLEEYRQCRIEQPGLGEEGCVLLIID